MPSAFRSTFPSNSTPISREPMLTAGPTADAGEDGSSPEPSTVRTHIAMMTPSFFDNTPPICPLLSSLLTPHAGRHTRQTSAFWNQYRPRDVDLWAEGGEVLWSRSGTTRV